MKKLNEIISQNTLNKLEASIIRYFVPYCGAISSNGYKRALKVAINEAYQKGLEDGKSF